MTQMIRPAAFLKEKISGSGLIKNITQLVFGNGIAQVITLLLSPVIMRLFTPAEFGIFSFFTVFVSAFALIATLRYEMAIVFAPDDHGAASVFRLSARIIALISLALLAGVVILNLLPAQMITTGIETRRVFWLLPLMVFMIGWTSILQNWFLRTRAFSILSAGRIVSSAGTNGSTLLLGLLGTGIWGLIGGYLLGLVFFLGFLLWFFSKNYRDAFPRGPYRIRESAIRYKDLPLSNSIQSLLEMLQNYGIIFLCRIFFTNAVVGLYALSMRILQAPLWLLGSSISQVYINEASAEMNSRKPIVRHFSHTVKIAAMVAAPVMLLIVVAGPWLFSFIFGSAWRDAGRYAAILSPWMFFDFIRYCIAQTPVMLGKTRLMMFMSLGGSVMMTLAFIAGSLATGEPSTGFVLLSVVMSVYAVSVILWIRQLAMKHDHNLKNPV